MLEQLHARRLILRPLCADDREAFAAMNRDPEVMRYLPGVLSRDESDALIGRIEAHRARHGFGLWAVEVPGRFALAGMAGLLVPGFEAAFTPCVEIGWRLVREAWGYGYATEAARAVVAHAFGPLGMRELVSFTTAENRRSRAVMQRLGMTRDPAEDFEHPGLPAGHPLRPHVLYRLRREPT